MEDTLGRLHTESAWSGERNVCYTNGEIEYERLLLPRMPRSPRARVGTCEIKSTGKMH